MSEIDFSHYESEWAESLNMDPDELERARGMSQFLSVDLVEATYKIPYDVLDKNVEVFDQIMVNFAPYQVFRSVFSRHSREVDMTHLKDKGLWDGDRIIESSSGSFMGDGLSFIHLTLLLTGCVQAASDSCQILRPMGQSVGDDLFIIKTSLAFCIAWCNIAEGLCCTFSKINSISEDSAMFCEQYLAIVKDREDVSLNKAYSGSQFRDITFLDTIKGSILGRQSKVKSDKQDAFIGHATMLSKQLAWHPSLEVAKKARAFLWSMNFRKATELTSSMCGLPLELGGAGMAIGKTPDYHSEEFKLKLPYYEAIVQSEQKVFMKYFLLLRGIYCSNPKGFEWENDESVIQEICKDLQLLDELEVQKKFPAHTLPAGTREKLSFMQRRLDMVSFFDLTAFLARQDAFMKQWEMVDIKTFTTLMPRSAKRRANKVWGIIKTDFDANFEIPHPSKYKSKDMKSLANAFRQRTFGKWVSKEDPAIKQAFLGTPLLFYKP